MLVLSRKPEEQVVIGGNVTLTVLSCEGGRVVLGITAPPEICILRGEILDRQRQSDLGTQDCSESQPINFELVGAS